MSPLGLGKIAAIERSIARAREEFAAAGADFVHDFTRQDAAILNILRACELAIDLANILIRERSLGVPQSSRDSFKLLADAALIPVQLSERLQRMIGFRNIAVHQYQLLDLAIVEAILRRDLDELRSFCQTVATLD
ncbi:MAG: type VII toxin-antitoxin system HepT family RNase toxin [Rudaea sp.]